MTMDSLLYAVFSHEMFLDIIILETFFGKDWEILMVTLEIHQLGWWQGMEWGGGVGTHQTKDLSV